MAKVISKDGTAIAFDRVGKGPPIILVDGAFCTRTFGPMPKLAPLLTEHFTVFIYDRRGRGESGGTAPYAVQREIEDLEALIKEAGGSAFVFGMSSGATLGLEAAAQKVNIRKMALYEPPVMVDGGGHRPPADYQAQLRRFIAEDHRGDAVKFMMTKVMGMPAIVVAVMRLLPVWSKLKAVANTLPYDAAITGDSASTMQRAHSVNIPTLVLGGEKSPSFLRSAVDAVAKALPDAERQILKGQTHNVSPKVLAPVLIEFFSA
jgi:pimeloyl-ACP methyl ester carboxylesterase